MNRNSQFNNITNEQFLLIDVLNAMYNDNIRQINNYTSFITELNANNNSIRNLLIQILNISLNNRRHNNNNNSSNSSNSNNIRNSSVSRNYQPLFDTVREYSIPFSQLSMLFDNNLQRNRSSVSPINTSNSTTSNNNSRFLESFFGPVEVYPTQSQIEAATRRVRYGDIVSPLNRSCPISMDSFEDDNMVTIIRHCRHIFTSDHLNTWFGSNCRCPVCRYDIRSDNSNAASEIFQPSQQRNQRQNVSQNTSEERNNSERITTSMVLNSLIHNLFSDVNVVQDPSGNLN